MAKTRKLGIIQSRGLGDIIIALPIAHYYHLQGYDVLWPICEPWVEQMTALAPWVKWIPLTTDSGAFFYDTPLERLRNFGCDEILPLYQALSGHTEFTQEPWFQHTSFDQYKYIRAGVPFINKWRLSDCITRDSDRESALYNKIIGDDSTPYVVTHLTSSEQTVSYDPTIIPEGWRTIPITNEGFLTDWLKIIEGAEAVIMTDSSAANLVDQLQIPVDRYFIPQHHIGLTPVQGMDWTWLPNPELKKSALIFRGG